MRIIELEFENINSYEGKVRIDFSDAAFRRNNNQFVISGETAAGKSTVLDAISLALYGATERAKRVVKNKDGSAPVIMNDRSGFCSAAITYTCSKGTFKNTFYQQRANKKITGKIQNPLCSIENTDTHEYILNSEKTTEKLADQTEKLIGLNYDQFIRCILIPQGEFDRFISGDEREKASILAKLSRTEFYKKVGARLSEQAADINKKYAEETRLIDQIEVLSEEERSEKENEKRMLENSLLELGKRITDLEDTIKIKNQADEAEKAFNVAGAEVKRINEMNSEYLKANEELEIARKAEKCKAEYDEFERLTADIVKEEKEISGLEQQLKEIETDLESATEYFVKCSNELDSISEEEKEKKALWNRVDELDREISARENSYADKKAALDKADKELVSGRNSLENMQKSIEILKQDILRLESYLEENKKDEKIGEVTAAVREMLNMLAPEEKTVKDSTVKKQKLEMSLANEIANHKKLLEEKKLLEDELALFVNSKHMIIAGILKSRLKQGNPCPVCGVPYQPEARHITKTNDCNFEEHSKVAADITEMSDNLNIKDEDIRKSEININTFENDIRSESEKIDAAKEKKNNLINEINEKTDIWGLRISSGDISDDAEAIIGKLMERYNTYNSRKNDKQEKSDEYSMTINKVSAIDIKKLESERENASEAFTEIDTLYKNLKSDRQALFGERKVEEEKADFEKQKEEARRRKESALEKINDIKIREAGIRSQKQKSAGSIEDLSIKLKESGEKYKSLFRENGFESEQSFLKGMRKEDEIRSLDKYIREYEANKKSADDSYDQAKNKLEELRSKNISDKSVAELRHCYEELKMQNDNYNQNIGMLTSMLAGDDLNRKKRAEAVKKIEDLSKQREIFNNIKNMVGKATGEDFEVFVQAIAMKSLIAKANEYLVSILPQYQLIQKENEVDFTVREEHMNGTFSDRNIDNFSGGEKFIISLSFALAIAECAGDRGSVDSIFLDEGFGTLSGQPLRDAINALKKLSSTGKMLGIITHVEPVIQEFMQIEARKIGDRSILKGPGIYCE